MKTKNPLLNPLELKRAITDSSQWQQQVPVDAGCETSEKLLMELQTAFIDPTEEVKPPPFALTVGRDQYNRSVIGTLGNFSLVIGKAKSRKTFFVSIALAAASSSRNVLSRFRGHLANEKNTVLLFDTEQADYHVHRVVKRVCRLMKVDTPSNFKAYGLRKYNPSERIELIKAAIKNEPKLGFVVIDGVRDLVTSINDEEQATAISHLFLKWTQEYQFHLMTVLHQNKGDNNARGHLGAELVNKAEITLSVTKDPATDFSIVEADFSRDREPEPLAFEVDHEGLPQLVEGWQLNSKSNVKKTISPLGVPFTTHIEVLERVFSKLPHPKYSQLWRQLKEEFQSLGSKIGDNKAKDFAQYYSTNEYIFRIGIEGSTNATYEFNSNKTEDGSIQGGL